MPKTKPRLKAAPKSTSFDYILARLFRSLLYILPATLFFSYFPVLSLGASASMNFEFSLPLIWLIIFDALSFVLLFRQKSSQKSHHKSPLKSSQKSLQGLSRRPFWKRPSLILLLAFPLFLTLSIIWSKNPLRGFLTAGILWLICFAIFSFFSLKPLFASESFKSKFWKFFFGSALVVSAWCWLQCLLDLSGISRDATLMCAGCTYTMFGFPHPNGFAIEPQFMGNLLLAPTLISLYQCLSMSTFSRSGAARSRRWLFSLMTLFFAATLFLTFSRGAIYALILGALVMTIYEFIKTKHFRIMLILPLIIIAFLLTLNAQGLMSEFSKTDDTYSSGVAKVLNHLSLGIIDIQSAESREITDVKVVENSVENSDADDINDLNNANDGIYSDASSSTNASTSSLATESADSTKAAFDGYVAESTDTRLRLSDSAIQIWRQSPVTILFGVGLGGAGQALYENGLSPAPKEIVQNEYISLLLEVGLVGIIILALSVVLILKTIKKQPLHPAVVGLVIAYAFSLLFFSGLPNALHIYLLPPLLYALGRPQKSN